MPVEVSDEDAVRTLVLNRPDKLNAFDQGLLRDLHAALTDAAASAEVRVVVLTGAGRAFSSGADMGELGKVTGAVARSDSGSTPSDGNNSFDDVITALAAFPKPLLIAVKGLGVGLGATILGFADLAFMSTDARLKCPFSAYGVPSEAASSYLLPRLIGRQNAAWMLMSSEWISAAEAKAMGLVWQVCEPADLLRVAHQHARLLAERSPSSLRMIKAAINAPLLPATTGAHRFEMGQFAEVMAALGRAE